MKMFKSSRFKLFGTLFATLVLCLIMSASVIFTASAQKVPCEGEIWGTDAETIDEAVEASKKIAEQMVREGQVLLKNNNALPMAGSEWVSILSTSGASANNNYVSGIESGGFKVFNTTTTDPSKYTDKEKRDHESSDVAIIMVKGVSSAYGDAGGPSGGEGQSTASVGDPEDHKDASGKAYTFEDGDPFVHKNLPYSENEGGEKDAQHSYPSADRLPVREPISLTTLAGCPNCQGVRQIEQRTKLLSKAAQARHPPQGKAPFPPGRREPCAGVGARSRGPLVQGENPLLLLAVPQKVV